MDCKEIAKEVKSLANLLKRRLDTSIAKASPDNITGVQVLILGFIIILLIFKYQLRLIYNKRLNNSNKIVDGRKISVKNFLPEKYKDVLKNRSIPEI